MRALMQNRQFILNGLMRYHSKVQGRFPKISDLVLVINSGLFISLAMQSGRTELRLLFMLFLCWTGAYPQEIAVGNTPLIIDAEHGQVMERL